MIMFRKVISYLHEKIYFGDRVPLRKKGTKWLLCDQMINRQSEFMGNFQITNRAEKLLLKKFLDLMLNSKSDQLSLVMEHFQIAYQIDKLYKRRFLTWSLVYKVTKWQVCDQMKDKLSLFMRYYQMAYQTVLFWFNA